MKKLYSSLIASVPFIVFAPLGVAKKVPFGELAVRRSARALIILFPIAPGDPRARPHRHHGDLFEHEPGAHPRGSFRGSGNCLSSIGRRC